MVTQPLRLRSESLRGFHILLLSNATCTAYGEGESTRAAEKYQQAVERAAEAVARAGELEQAALAAQEEELSLLEEAKGFVEVGLCTS
jgi:predicted deacetylase